MKTKQELRVLFRQERKKMTDAEREEMSSEIAKHYLTLFEEEKPKVIHLFLPIVPLLEVNSFLILKTLNQHHPKVKTLTSIIAEDQENLLTVEVRYDTPLVTNTWGIQEPRTRILCDEGEIEEVLTPLLGVDERGFRVGYGKGFYDRFFQLCSPGCKKTGLNFFKPVEDSLMTDDWDVPLTRLIHPQGIINF